MLFFDEETLTSESGVPEDFLKQIINDYTKMLYNFIRRFGFSDEETEDILQEVFVKVWKYKDSFDETKSALKTWVFTITKNTVYDTLRKKKNRTVVYSLDTVDDDGITHDVEDSSKDVLVILEKELQNKDILSAIDSLQENEKTILLLHFEEDMTFNEIGLLFNVSLNTVKSTYRRTLLKLKSILLERAPNKG